jgi:chromosome segregation ATPase
MENEITIENLQQEVATLKAENEALKEQLAKSEQNAKMYYEWYSTADKKFGHLNKRVKSLAYLLADAVDIEKSVDLPF